MTYSLKISSEMSKFPHCAACFVVLLTLALLSSCGTVRHTGSSKGATTAGGRPATQEVPRHIDLSLQRSEATQTLLREADSWIGTAYRYGGNDRNGVDCSGFVAQVFNSALRIKLPRTSQQQHDFCTAINRGDLREGDLVFFTVRGGSKIGHVGIYIGNDQMVHASASKGVIISSLSQNYYTDNFFGAGRIERFHALAAQSKTAQTPAEPQPKPQPKPQPRTPAPVAVKAAPMPAPSTTVASEPAPESSGLEDLADYFD